MVPASFISKGQIDEYAKYLQDFVLDLVEKTVPTAKSHQEASTPRCRWWTSEVDKARDAPEGKVSPLTK